MIRAEHGHLMRVSFAILFIAMCQPCYAAGFDCHYAKSRVEKLICTDPALSNLDDKMKILYDKIESETFGRDGITGEPVDPAGKDQRQWREHVRDACMDTTCLKRVYVARLAEMRKRWTDALQAGD